MLLPPVMGWAVLYGGGCNITPHLMLDRTVRRVSKMEGVKSEDE
jgi:hypothetical protein